MPESSSGHAGPVAANGSLQRPGELIGGVDGTFKGNRHIVFPDNVQRCSNMLLSLLDLHGIHRDGLGDSTGRLPGLA